MRLFIAINFDQGILHALTEFQDVLRRKGVRGNYTPKENLHLTLAFIGDYGDQNAVLHAMESARFHPTGISLDGVGSFGNLFWVGIRENPELFSYVKRLRRELSERGIPFDKKHFSPHITLIRKASFGNSGFIPVDAPPKGHMTATRVSLMRSERGQHGMIYTEIRG